MMLDGHGMEEAHNRGLPPSVILCLNTDSINQYVRHLADRRPVSRPPHRRQSGEADGDGQRHLQLVIFLESTNTSDEVNAKLT